MNEGCADIAAIIETSYTLEAEKAYVQYPRSATDKAAIAVIEVMRRKAVNDRQCELIPTDLFLPLRGRSIRRDVTKIGGLPFFQARRPWPCTTEGCPFTFLAQFRFVESRDIVPVLPGDILLVFARDNVPYEGDPPWIHFEWESLGSNSLIRDNDVPDSQWPFWEYRCERIRTSDIGQNCQRNVFVESPWLGQLSNVNDAASILIDALCSFDGVKIGGRCPRDVARTNRYNERRFLCSVPSIVEQSDNAMSDERWTGLLWRDGATLAIFLDEQAPHLLSWELIIY